MPNAKLGLYLVNRAGAGFDNKIWPESDLAFVDETVWTLWIFMTRDLVSREMMARSQQSKQMNRKYADIDCIIFRKPIKYETLQYLYVPFCKSRQKSKSGYRLVKMASFQPQPEAKSGTALCETRKNFSHECAHCQGTQLQYTMQPRTSLIMTFRLCSHAIH